VEAKAPMAIVIPVRGSLPIKGLRVSDLSWQEFLGRVNHSKYAISLSCLIVFAVLSGHRQFIG
jgi:hypothetical protein